MKKHFPPDDGRHIGRWPGAPWGADLLSVGTATRSTNDASSQPPAPPSRRGAKLPQAVRAANRWLLVKYDLEWAITSVRATPPQDHGHLPTITVGVRPGTYTAPVPLAELGCLRNRASCRPGRGPVQPGQAGTIIACRADLLRRAAGPGHVSPPRVRRRSSITEQLRSAKPISSGHPRRSPIPTRAQGALDPTSAQRSRPRNDLAVSSARPQCHNRQGPGA